MSIPAIRYALSTEMMPSHKFVLMIMADLADENGQGIFPSVGYLVQKSGYCERQIQYIRRDLQNGGHIWPDGDHAINGQRDRKTIQFAMRVIPQGAAEQGATNAPGVARCTVKVQPNAPTEVQPNAPDPLDDLDPEDRSVREDPQKGLAFGEEAVNGASASNGKEKLDPDGFFEAWNEFADEQGLPEAMELTASRRKKLLARFKEHPDAKFWDAVLDGIADSAFLRGRIKRKEGQRYWCVDFDWLVKNDSNCVRIAEGRY